jgi:RNA polymerase sigma-70 factor (ECF subfamily)
MGVTDQEFEQAVRAHYADVFRFALSLTKREADACDLTQESFYLLNLKGRQVDDATKLKSWLFTTCYREFLRGVRHQARFPHVELSLVEETLPDLALEQVSAMDADLLMRLLQEMDELYRVPVMLFYLQGHAYKVIAAMLNMPVGTVMSRLARGKEQLRQLLAKALRAAPDPAVARAGPAYRERQHE